MNKLALTLPGFSPIPAPSGLNPEFVDLASIVSSLLQIVLFIAIFLAFYFLIWGAYAYILSSGKKEELGRARARITWALVGLLVVLMAFFLAKFASEIFPPTKGGLPF